MTGLPGSMSMAQHQAALLANGLAAGAISYEEFKS
jgi:hypothetical protein